MAIIFVIQSASMVFHRSSIDIVVQRSLLLQGDSLSGYIDLPAFEDLTESYSRYRMPVGPTLRLADEHLANDPRVSNP